jgi:hypothetical protein
MNAVDVMTFLTLICAAVSAIYDHLEYRDKIRGVDPTKREKIRKITKRSWLVFGSAAVLVVASVSFYFVDSSTEQSCSTIDSARLALLPNSANYRIFGGNRISLQKCLVRDAAVDCYFYLTKTTPGDQSFSYDSANGQAGGGSILYDDNQNAHNQISGTFLDPKCKPLDHVDLSQGETAQFVQRFSGPPNGLKSAKITFPPNGWGILSLRVP